MILNKRDIGAHPCSIPYFNKNKKCVSPLTITLNVDLYNISILLILSLSMKSLIVIWTSKPREKALQAPSMWRGNLALLCLPFPPTPQSLLVYSTDLLYYYKYTLSKMILVFCFHVCKYFLLMLVFKYNLKMKTVDLCAPFNVVVWHLITQVIDFSKQRISQLNFNVFF